MSYAGVWFRGDVRLAANPAVAAASEVNSTERAIPALLLLCPEQMREHDWAPIKWDLLRRHLHEFVKDAAEHGYCLVDRGD